MSKSHTLNPQCKQHGERYLHSQIANIYNLGCLQAYEDMKSSGYVLIRKYKEKLTEKTLVFCAKCTPFLNVYSLLRVGFPTEVLFRYSAFPGMEFLFDF